MNANLFVFAAAGILGLKKPVEIRLLTKSKAASGHKEIVAAFYGQHTRKGKIVKHIITLNMREIVESNYSLSEVIAHELVHACQFENGIFNEKRHHDAKFQKLCKVLEKGCTKLGFPLKNLYNAETDTD